MVRSRVPTARQPPRRLRPPKRSHCLQLPPESGCVFSLFFFLHVSAEFLLGTLPERRVRLLRPPLEMLFWRSFRSQPRPRDLSDPRTASARGQQVPAVSRTTGGAPQPREEIFKEVRILREETALENQVVAFLLWSRNVIWMTFGWPGWLKRATDPPLAAGELPLYRGGSAGSRRDELGGSGAHAVGSPFAGLNWEPANERSVNSPGRV
ncbi:uncharacterized protein LOC142361858 isoform X2 [Opisthocomus hoazin]|uniref:uncharacterized protein LOC142361858 isoform X2 n=1 Tax=Opisthocomus hoazin TaxID=30419 RepID=UPI003F52B9FF